MKLFASDYDGTLFKNHEITSYDLEMIHAFREAGNKFGIATGRTIDSITFELEKYNIPFDFIVGINGGVVLSEDREELYLSSFNKEVIPELMETLLEEKVLYYGINDGYGLARVFVEQDFPDYEFNIELMDIDLMINNGVKGLYVRHASEDHAQDLSDKINERYAKEGIFSFPNYQSVDIGAKGVTKSTGIKQILKHYKMNESTTVFTIGDASNDEPMIRDYYGFAMDNGLDDIKQKSKEVVVSVGQALDKAMKL